MVDGILEKDQGNIGANFLKGRLLLVKRDYANALERFNLVVRESPRNAMGYHFRALSHIGKGESKLAGTGRLILIIYYVSDLRHFAATFSVDASRISEMVWLPKDRWPPMSLSGPLVQ